MPRAFAHVRLSTVGQTALNQIREIAAAGFAFEPHRVVAETVSGSEAIARRREFGRLLDRLERGNVLVVTRLDRLGRDAIDVAATVGRLEASGVRVHCLALGGVDLASSAGKMTMGVIIAVAQIERDLLIERPQSGLARAEGGGRRAEGAGAGGGQADRLSPFAVSHRPRRGDGRAGDGRERDRPGPAAPHRPPDRHADPRCCIENRDGSRAMSDDFKGRRFRGEAILWAVRWHGPVRDPLPRTGGDAGRTRRDWRSQSRSTAGCSATRPRWSSACAGTGSARACAGCGRSMGRISA